MNLTYIKKQLQFLADKKDVLHVKELLTEEDQVLVKRKAMYHLSKQGVKFAEESITRNKKTNRINFVYLDLEIAGFGIHLINPDLKMEI